MVFSVNSPVSLSTIAMVCCLACRSQPTIFIEWFNTHLEKPTRFTASNPPYYRKKSRAISWFKDTAHEHIGHIREMVAILENHGVSVRMLKADRVGYVVYEDDYQIVAEPFSDVQC